MKSLILLILVAAVVYYVWNSRRSGGKDRNVHDIPWSEKEAREDDALRILRERYAKGEIDHETYEKMKNDLKYELPGLNSDLWTIKNGHRQRRWPKQGKQSVVGVLVRIRPNY